MSGTFNLELKNYFELDGNHFQVRNRCKEFGYVAV